MRIVRDSTDFRIYTILSKNPASGEKLADELGISRAAVWKMVQKLRENGVDVLSGRKGYIILGERELNPYEVAEISFRNGFEEIHYFEETDSTNERAKEYGRAKCLFFANRQTAGKGRHGRSWISEKGGLYFSMTFSPPLDYSELPKLTLVAGLSVAEAIPEAEIKWPNDILLKGKKVCGILSELHGEIEKPLVVVGIGINVENPVPEELNATSLSQFQKTSRKDVFEEVLSNFHRNYKKLLNGKWGDLRRKIELLCSTIGKEVKVITTVGEIRGRAERIAEDGSLVVDGRRIYAGECVHLR